ncbi:hypothetical protein HYFRA_00011352 [Hymenoscyphus fraxineus]|uniref:Uncharacterized protein n=1 Tax=Hymenoscyphus fraxineus TaxID=746836 RepID=A0A9N9KZ15_9HELO|nr:hypothetical protein HYFRA_00011352 [Hymenoscyphus fraxineus]
MTSSTPTASTSSWIGSDQNWPRLSKAIFPLTDGRLCPLTDYRGIGHETTRTRVRIDASSEDDGGNHRLLKSEVRPQARCSSSSTGETICSGYENLERQMRTVLALNNSRGLNSS